jgi:hypothetical protein
MMKLKHLIVLAGCTTVASSATGGATGASFDVSGFPLANVDDSNSPTYIVLNTLGNIETDASNINTNSSSSYKSISLLCNTTITDLRQQVENDESEIQKKHNVLSYDVKRITAAAERVNKLENKVATLKVAVFRSNRTLSAISNIHEIQKGFFQGHSNFLVEARSDLQRLHSFLDAPPSHLSKNGKPIPTAMVELAKKLQQRTNLQKQHMRRLRHAQRAILMDSATSSSLLSSSTTRSLPPHSVQVNKITDVTPEPPSFHSLFHTSLDELHSYLTNATDQHAIAQDESKKEYSQAYDTLSTESLLQNGKMIQLRAHLEEAQTSCCCKCYE